MRRRGFTLIELLVVIAIIALLMGILMPALNEARNRALILVCGSNLSGLGKACELYATENHDTFPRSAGAGSTWSTEGTINRWSAPFLGTEEEAFAITATVPGQGTITSCWYLLVKYASVKPDQFVCKGDDAQVFDIAATEASRLSRTLETVWDFGGCDRGLPLMPGEMVSYAYQMPFNVPNPHGGPGQPGTVTFCIIDQSNPGTPVAADRNPHLSKEALAIENMDVGANSFAHQGKGQNVLFKDGRVEFLKKNGPRVGIGGDNIYTHSPITVDWRDGGGQDGTPPTGNGDAGATNPGPEGLNDGYLVLEVNYQ